MKNLSNLGIVALIALIVLIAISNSLFYTLEPGESAIIFERFTGGIDKDREPSGPGLHLISPWNKAIRYDIREQILLEEMDVLSSNSLEIHVDVSIRFHPKKSELAQLHEEIGPNYGSIIVKDVLRSTVRKVIGQHTPEELTTTKREEIQTLIETEVQTLLGKKYILTDAVMIRSIELPEKLKQSILDKLHQQQEAQKYEFKIQKETLEKQRKIIEAEGIKAYQDIVSRGLTPQYLRWKGIEATEKLADSDNAKIVVIGSGSDGLPLILGQ